MSDVSYESDPGSQDAQDAGGKKEREQSKSRAIDLPSTAQISLPPCITSIPSI
jgi:hypothetical protein